MASPNRRSAVSLPSRPACSSPPPSAWSSRIPQSGSKCCSSLMDLDPFKRGPRRRVGRRRRHQGLGLLARLRLIFGTGTLRGQAAFLTVLFLLAPFPLPGAFLSAALFQFIYLGWLPYSSRRSWSAPAPPTRVSQAHPGGGPRAARRLECWS